MADLKDIIAYVVKNYPHKDDMSNARVTKMIFLSDWHYAINREKQISNIEWEFNSYGPFVTNVKEEVKRNPDLFTVKDTNNIYGERKVVFQMKDESYEPELSEDEKHSIDHVIDKTKQLSWSAFIKLVYSTYPIMSSERYSTLNLVQKAKEYEEVFRDEG